MLLTSLASQFRIVDDLHQTLNGGHLYLMQRLKFTTRAVGGLFRVYYVPGILLMNTTSVKRRALLRDETPVDSFPGGSKSTSTISFSLAA